MNTSGGRARLLFGTDEPVEAPRRLRAGDLSVAFGAGALRDIRWGGLEVLRGVAFVLRDTCWGTYSPVLTGLTLREQAGGFEVSYDGSVVSEDGDFAYAVRIEGQSDGHLRVFATGSSINGFRTNRTGFVVLHPLEGVVGRPLTVGHPDGSSTVSVFPRLVKPDQPARDIVRLAHCPAPDLQVEVGFSGEVFEMEDHRNWTDASFKTYVRPLSRGYPYTIESGETVTQAVEIDVSGPVPTAADQGGSVSLRWGAPGEGTVPELGLYIDHEVLADFQRAVDAMLRFRPSYVQARVDLRDAGGTEQLDQSLELARSAGCRLQLDVVIAGLDPVAELRFLAAWQADLGPVLDALFVIPARDLRSRPPGDVFGEASADAILDAAKTLFPRIPIGAGMPVGFTELNRNPPPVGADWVGHATQAIVHAADDVSVMETLQALPDVVATTRAHAGKIPYRIGPATIGMVPSASASTPVDTSGDRRIALTSRDPRQDGLFAAAFLLGYVAAVRDVQAITPAAPTGRFGLVDAYAMARPLASVFAGLASRAGQPRLSATHRASGRLAAIAIQTDEGAELWVANLTSDPVKIQLYGPVVEDLMVSDANSLSHLPVERAYAETTPPALMTLDSFAVARARSWAESVARPPQLPSEACR